MEKRTCVISEVIYKRGNVPPIIGHFENGNLKPQAGNVQKCGIFRRKNEDKYIVAVHTSDNALYMGKEPSEEVFRTLLAIQDNKSNKVRLIEVDKVELEPKSVICSVSSNNQKSTVADLYKSFGSKVVKRKTEQRERLLVNVEAFSNRLQDTASGIKADNSLKIMDDAEYQGTYVPCNRDATDVNDVYKVEDIISDNELEDLQNETFQLLTNSVEDNMLNYSEFFNQNLKEIPETNNFYCTQLLLYSECVVQFLSLDRQKLKKKDAIVCPFSETVNRKILETFCVKGKGEWKITPSLKDKALCHAIVAGLLACNFTLHVGSLFHLTRTPVEKFFNLCRVLGAVPKNKDEKSTIVLRVPIPVVSRPRMIKKKREFH